MAVTSKTRDSALACSSAQLAASTSTHHHSVSSSVHSELSSDRVRNSKACAKEPSSRPTHLTHPTLTLQLQAATSYTVSTMPFNPRATREKRHTTICSICEKTLPDLLLKRRFMHDHQPSLRALLRSSEQGCKTCAIFYHNFAYTGYEEATLDSGKLIIGRMSNQESLKVALSGDHGETTYGAEIPSITKQDVETEVRPSLGRAADDAENIGLVKALLSDCLQNHPTCTQAGAGTAMPTRLLDVKAFDDDSKIRIVPGTDAQAHHGRFVCLSHCWGLVPPDAPWKLTQSRKSAYMAQVSMDILPPTFQQAIKYTRDLSERYLWIDSLCIIQDSTKDWAIEASNMAKIYTNSLITLSAATSSSKDGCILERDSKLVDPVTIDLDPGKQSSSRASIFHSVPEDSKLQLSVPVTKRAWCLQERRLAVRILQFTPYQWVWTCRMGTTSERALRKLDISADTLSDVFGDHRNTSSARNTRGDGLISDETEVHRFEESRKKYTDWYKIVEDFTRCDITYPTDRLPAINGIAQRQQSLHSDTYLVGLWQDDILYGLIWSVATAPRTRPAEYIAPSWSWACLNTWIRFNHFMNYKDRCSPTLICANILRDPANPLTIVTGSYLRLKGYLQPLASTPLVVTKQERGSSLWTRAFPGQSRERTLRARVDENGLATREILSLDTESDADDCDSLVCLAVLDEKGLALKQIVVQGCTERPTYMRVGMVTFRPEYFEGALKQEIDLY